MEKAKAKARKIYSQNDTAERTRTPPSELLLPIDVEDEITWVLHEFRRQSSPIFSIEKGIHNRNIRTKKRPFPGYFSDVRYHSISVYVDEKNIHKGESHSSTRGQYIMVSYLFDQVLSLEFRVDIRPMRKSDSGQNDWGSDNKSYRTHVNYVGTKIDNCSMAHFLSRKKFEVLKAYLQSICGKLNADYSESAKSSSSLFAVLSKLLSSLNLLQTKVFDAKKDTKSKESNLLLPLTVIEKSNCLKLFLQKDSPFLSCSGGVDLAILLLRCAAVGKHAEEFAHPFPSNGESIAKSIWNATENYQQFQRRRKANAKTAFHPKEHELLGFLCSLSWMKRGRITVTENSKSDDTRADERIIFEVCLDLDDNHVASDASYSPKFARSCQRRGSMIAYHGTDMENVWSILHNGFFNASEIGRGGNKFVKNGAIMGSGVYLSTSKKVANYFATMKVTSPTIRNALRHDSLNSLLSKAPTNEILFHKKDTGRSTPSIDDLCDVSCFPVFEARIIRPPIKESKDAKVKNNCSDSSDTRHEGKYYVVPDGRDVRIIKLHLTFELTRRKGGLLQFLYRATSTYTMKSTMGISIILAVVVLIFAIALGKI